MQYILIFFLFTISSFGFDYHLSPYPLTKNIDCFFGFQDKAKESNGGRVINTCYIKSSDGYVVIDSGPTYAYAQQAYTAMQKKEKLPVKYVINTSSQELHILGNEFYKEQGATLIAPKSYEKLIKEQKPLSLLEKLSNAIFENTRLIPADVYQNEDTNISIGETQIEIKKLEKNDSKNLIVYFPSEETIFVGNFISNKRVPILQEHNTLDEWMINLHTIENFSWKHIISAHGVKRNKEALSCTKNYLTKLKKNALDSIENPTKSTNKKLFTSCENIVLFNDFHTDNIQKAYDELKSKVATNSVTEEELILTAMSNIKIEKILKEGTTKAILVTEKPTVPHIKEQKKSKKETVKLAKVKITKEISVQSIIEKASKTKIAPTTEGFVPSIRYDKDFYTAQQHAIKEHKMVLIKVEADNCHPCEDLNKILANNKNIKRMINKYTTAIKVNTSYESVPLGLTNRGTPTLFVINPETEKILMQLEGSELFEDLEDSLKSILPESKLTSLALAQ